MKSNNKSTGIAQTIDKWKLMQTLDHKLSPPLRLLTHSPSPTLHGFLNIGAAAYADISGADRIGASDIQ